MPKRLVVALATTAVALALLLSFKTPSQPGATGAGSANGGTGGSALTAPATRPPATAAPGGVARVTPAPKATATPGDAGGASQTVQGPVVPTRFGDVQVQVTVTNGRLTDVTALQLPTGRRSGDISDYAEPILRSEALQVQSAQIDIVSGATYTSEAYARSLQSALDQARG